MASTVEDIKQLREETGAGVMEARKALQDAGNDKEKAKKLLEQRGAASAAKRSGREAGQGTVEAYIHTGGQQGALVELDSETDFVSRMPEFRELAREIAMQVCAMRPRYLSGEEVPAEEEQELRARFRQEALDEGKPENIVDKIAEGKYRSYLKSVSLVDQEYIRDSSKTIRNLIEELAAKTRENIVIKRFSRFEVGK